MGRRNQNGHTMTALRIVGIYAVVGALWIFFSDSALKIMVSDTETMSRIAIMKGWAYVAVTAALLFVLINRAMRALAAAEEKRAKSEARYRALFEHSGDALLIHTPPDWSLSDANAAALKLFGYTEVEELLKAHPADLSPPIQPDGEASRAKSEKMLRTAFELGNEIFHWRSRRSDGVEFDTAVRLTKIEFEGRTSVLAAIRDVTELNRVQAERQEMERRLLHAQKLESLGVLAGGLAHDFNNLIAAAKGNLELALLAPEKSEKQRQIIDNANAALKRAAQLTSQMLDYSRKRNPALEDVDLNLLIAENSELLRAVIPKSIAIRLDLTEGHAKVRGDGGQLHQVIMNLMTNASEAIAGAEGLIQISTGTAFLDEAELSRSMINPKPPPGSFAMVEVIDNGSGMDSQTLHRLFEPFFTSKKAGRGLGMAVVMQIVQSHGGAVIVDTEQGRGTSIKIALPATAQSEGEYRTDLTATEYVERKGVKLTKKAILLAEDDDQVRQMCRTMLSLLGYETIEAKNGTEAVALWKENRDKISVILLDLTMPVMGGQAVLLELGNEGSKTPVILTSGADPKDLEGIGRASGYVKKPYSMGELGLAISKALAEAE